jgi:hypothetical protein
MFNKDRIEKLERLVDLQAGDIKDLRREVRRLEDALEKTSVIWVEEDMRFRSFDKRYDVGIIARIVHQLVEATGYKVVYRKDIPPVDLVRVYAQDETDDP